MKSKKKYKYDPDYAVPPGETLKETLECNNISIEEFANRCGLKEILIKEIIAGKYPITQRLANKFEEHTGISAQFWMNREDDYRYMLEKLKRKK